MWSVPDYLFMVQYAQAIYLFPIHRPDLAGAKLHCIHAFVFRAYGDH